MNRPSAITLTLCLASGGSPDAEELDLETRMLRRELLTLDIDSAELLRREHVPAGAKAADAVTIGALAIAVLPAVVPRLVEFLQAWVMRGQSRAISFKGVVGGREIQLNNVTSPEELMTIIELLSASTKDASGQPPNS